MTLLGMYGPAHRFGIMMSLFYILKFDDPVHYKSFICFHLRSKLTTFTLVSCTPALPDWLQLHGSVLQPTGLTVPDALQVFQPLQPASVRFPSCGGLTRLELVGLWLLLTRSVGNNTVTCVFISSLSYSTVMILSCSHCAIALRCCHGLGTAVWEICKCRLYSWRE